MTGLYAVGLAALVPGLLGVELPLLLPHAWHKVLHIFGVILFVGNSVAEVVWITSAWRSGDPRLQRFAIRGLVWGDAVLSAGGFALTLVNGAFLAGTWEGGLLGPSWLVASLVLLGVMGAIAMALMPSVKGMWELAERGLPDEPLGPDLDRHMKRWNAIGSLIMLPMLGIFWLMVAKPVLWE
jgi:uncharacterized membrane protein